MTGVFRIAQQKQPNLTYCKICKKETISKRNNKYAICKECKSLKGIYAGEEK